MEESNDKGNRDINKRDIATTTPSGTSWKSRKRLKPIAPPKESVEKKKQGFGSSADFFKISTSLFEVAEASKPGKDEEPLLDEHSVQVASEDGPSSPGDYATPRQGTSPSDMPRSASDAVDEDSDIVIVHSEEQLEEEILKSIQSESNYVEIASSPVQVQSSQPPIPKSSTKNRTPSSQSAKKKGRNTDMAVDMDPEIAARVRRRLQERGSASAGFSVTVRLISQIPELNYEDEFKTSSDAKLSDLKGNLLERLAKMPRNSDAALLYWKEQVKDSLLVMENGTTILYDIATPRSAGVKLDDPKMTVLMMTKNDYKNVMTQRKALRTKAFTAGKENDLEEDIIGYNGEEADGNDNYNGNANVDADASANADPNANANNDGYFRILLKGKDNDPVAALVNAETPIMKLIEHYRAKKYLGSNAKVRLEFDDEDLDPKQTVGDTELEEDFTVDVYVS